MQLIYEGRDITPMVRLHGARYSEALGKADSMEITLSNPGTWLGWKPRAGDRVHMTLPGGGQTDEMTLDGLKTEGGEITLMALSALPGVKTSGFYPAMPISQLLGLIAGEMGAKPALYMKAANALLPPLIRDRKGPLAFLSSAARLAGAFVRCRAGVISVVGTDYAQNLAPVFTGRIGESETQGVEMLEQPGGGLGALTVHCESGSGRAKAQEGRGEAHIYLPCQSPALAREAARNILKLENMENSTLTLETGLNLALTPLAKAEITFFDRAGQYLIKACEHDLGSGRTRCTLMHTAEAE